MTTSRFPDRPRYLGNSNTKEVHDLENENTNCQIDEIIAHRHDVGFHSLSTAKSQGYHNGHYCLGD